MRRQVGRALLVGVVMATVLTQITAAEAADPPGTLKLDAELTSPPDVRVLGASPAGVLYTVANRNVGNNVPADDPSGRAQATWLAVAGKSPVRLDAGYRTLSGDYVFATGGGDVSFRHIGTGAVRTCATASLPEAFIPTGWIDVESTGQYKLTTIEANGCGVRSLATHPGTVLKAADDRGFVVQDNTTANRQLKYAAYADPATLRTIAMGNQHGLLPDQVRLAGDAVAWNIENTAAEPRGWVYRGSTTGTAPTETAVRWPINALAVTPTHTGWTTEEVVLTGYDRGGFETVALDGTRQGLARSTASVASSGTRFVIDAPVGATGGAGVVASDSSSGFRWGVQSVPWLPPVASAVAIGGGRVSYSDARGWHDRHYRLIRGYVQGSQPVLGSEVWPTGSYSYGPLSQDGRRTAFTTDRGLFVQAEGQAARQLWFARPDRFIGTLAVSGTRVLWVVMKPDPNCSPPNCQPPQPETVNLYDELSGETTVLPGQPNASYGLWGNYFVASKADGTILRRDLSSTLVQQVKGPGQRLAGLDAHGSFVAWSSCESENCDGDGTRIGYRNMATAAAPVELPTSKTRDVRLSGGHLAYATGSGANQTLALQGLGSASSAVIGPLSGGLLQARQPFDIHDETVAWVGQDVTARIAPVPAYVDPPRYLGNAVVPTSFEPAIGGRWPVEFPVSKRLSACGIAIDRGTTRIRAIDCATTTGSALASWDGRDSAGRLVPKGQYTWTLHARDADGWLLSWNGSSQPIRGTVSVQ